MIIYIASDHGGFDLKTELVPHLKSSGHEVIDMGPLELQPEDDYPDYIVPAINKIKENLSSEVRGILLCRNGVGVSMLANKYIGIRCALSWTEDHAKTTRTDDDTNVLALPADYINTKQAQQITDTWLNTPFSGEERHIRRLSKFSTIGE
ncbi:MAG: RpiB/LacA/LacB family sugar-phosphate isomerase [Patescibacteria group bacterium]